MADFYTVRLIGYETIYAEDEVDALDKMNERLNRPDYRAMDLRHKSLEVTDGEHDQELIDALTEMVNWARDIAGDCADEIQRESEDAMMARMDNLLAKINKE